MSVVRAVLGTAVLLFSFMTPAQVRAASNCGFNIGYAELVAVGTAHREALYLLSVGSQDSANRRANLPIAFHLTAGTGTGVTTAFDAEQVAPSPDDGWNAAMFLVVLPAPGIRWFSLDSITADKNSMDCKPVEEYVLPESLYSTDSTFDDGASAQGPLPLALVFEPPPFSHKVQPNYPLDAREQNVQGDVTVAVTIDATGKTTDATVVTSSGYRALDYAALDAARASGFGPLVMPAALSVKPAALRFVIIYSFRLDV